MFEVIFCLIRWKSLRDYESSENEKYEATYGTTF